MLRVLLPLLAVGLAVYALVDLASSDEEDRAGIPKGLWIVLIVLLPFLGPIAWIVVKRSQRSTPRYGARPSANGPGRIGGAGPARRRRSGPLAPDDDPEFLWRLEQERRRRSRGSDTPPADEARGGPATPGPQAPSDGSAQHDGGAPETGADDGDDAAAR